MDMRAMRAVRGQIPIQPFYLTIREIRVFGDQADDIHAKTIHALFQPPAHHIIDLRSYIRVIPVQIRLLFRENMQIIHIGRLIILPCASAEPGSPVIRLFSVFSLFPDVKITVRVFPALSALHKPCMFIGCMVDHEIHDDTDVAHMRFRQKPVKILHASEFFHDLSVITDIISVIVIR